MEGEINIKKPENIEPRDRGRNFNEAPLTYDEFIAKNSKGHPMCNNFFLNFYNYKEGMARNYEMLKKINPELANELSEAWKSKTVNTEEVLKKGYEAYLILRENYKNDPALLERISEYYEGDKINTDDGNETDDWPAFFS